jgi:hypothetical protein
MFSVFHIKIGDIILQGTPGVAAVLKPMIY